MRKRPRYNHWGGSGMRRSTAIIPTKARNGAMYPMVARRRASMDRDMCDELCGVWRPNAMVTQGRVCLAVDYELNELMESFSYHGADGYGADRYRGSGAGSDGVGGR